MGGIFVSYRRKDSAGHAGRLFDRLVDHFGRQRVFRDVDQLRPGDDFVDALAGAVGSCEAFILIIGRDWLDARDERGARRIDDPEDFIRLELETALRRKVLVLPVLVEGAAMIDAADLPEPLRPLARRQAIELSEHRWDFDVQELLKRIEEVVKPTRSGWKTPALKISAALVLLAAVAFGTRSYWLPQKSTPADNGSASTPARPEPPREDPPPSSKTEDDRARGGGISKPDEAKATPAPETTPPKTDPAPARGPSDTPAGRAPVRPTVPQFVGLTLRQIQNSLQTLGLVARVESRSTGTKPAGTVLRQDPRAGSPLTEASNLHLEVEQGLGPEEEAAGVRYLSVMEILFLDRDEPTDRQAGDVSLQRPNGTNLVLQLASGVTGVRLSPAATSARMDPAQCRNVTAAWSNRNIVIPQSLENPLNVCVRTTKGRLSMLRLEELTAKGELKVRFSTLR